MLAMNEQPRKKPEFFQVLALIFGVAALLGACTGMSFLFGGMGICFALLSRKPRMRGNAKAGFTLCLVACALSGIIFAASFHMLVKSGLWDRFQERAQTVDFTSDREVMEFRDEMMQDIMEYYQQSNPLIYGDAASEQENVADDPVDDNDKQGAVQVHFTEAEQEGETAGTQKL